MNQVQLFKEMMAERKTMSIEDQVYHTTIEEFDYQCDILVKEKQRLLNDLYNVDKTLKTTSQQQRKFARQMIDRKLSMVNNMLQEIISKKIKYIAESCRPTIDDHIKQLQDQIKNERKEI